MDFRSLLQSMTSLSEAETKDTKTGRVHKGDYGTSYDGDDEKKPAASTEKRGRGRPKKGADDSGEVKSYDTKSLGSVFGGGQKPKKEIGKVSKKHSLKEYMESAEATKEAEAVMEGIFGGVDHDYVSGNLGKLARVIKSVQTPEQFAVAQKYAQRMKGTIMNHQHDKMGFGSGIRANMGVMRDVDADLKAKAQELGIEYQALEETGEQVEIKPAQQNTQVIQQGNKTLGTVTNPQLANQIKQAIGQGQMSLTGDDEQQGMMEGKDQGKPGKNFAKIAKSAGKEYGSKAAGERVAGAVKAKLAKQGKLEEAKKESEPEGTYSKKRFETDGQRIARIAKEKRQAEKKKESEKVDEGAKPDFLDVDKDKNKKESFKKAVKDKEAKKKVDESISLSESPETLQHIISKYKHEVKTFINGDEMDHDLYEALFDYYFNAGEMPYGVAKARSGDPYEWVSERFDQDVHDHVVDEGATRDFRIDGVKPTSDFTPVGSSMAAPRGTPTTLNRPVPNPTPFGTDPIAATTDRAINFISGLRKPSNPFSESKTMKDMQVESWSKQLDNLLNEGITVSSSQGQQGQPDSVSVTASEGDAEQLMQVLRSAGIGGFGAGEQQPEIGYGVAQGGEEEFDGTGTEPQAAPGVVGDDGDMLAMLKKMSGLSTEPAQGGEEGGQDYEDEEGSEVGALEPADGEEEGSDSQFAGDESSDEEGEDEGSADEEVTDEGNAFGQEVRQKKADNIPDSQQRIKTGGQNLPVKEGETECNECGMMESSCECDHDQVNEFANDAGGDAMGDAQLMKLKALLSVGNDLHRMKTSQAMGNPVRVTESKQMINEWKKLSGI